MKQTIKYILALVVMILSTTGIMAKGNATYIYKINGAAAGTTDPGSVTYGNGVITVTPKNGYYLTVADLTVIKTLDGQSAEARQRVPGFNNTVVVTAQNASADPSKVTKYNITVTDPNYDYEITANFHTRTSVAGATVTVAPGTYTYTGAAVKPDVTVVVGGKTLTKGTDYNVYYADSINAGTGKITVVGTRTYNGTKTGTVYTIAKAAGSISYAGDVDKKDNDAAFTNTLTKTGDGTVSYKSSDPRVATVDATTGQVTILDDGAVTITATVTDGANYTYATKTATYNLTIAPTLVKYKLWIGNVHVSEANCSNVLGDAGNTFQYIPRLNKLFITNTTAGLNIESRMDEGLIIYLGPNSENLVGQIKSTVEAPLTVTTDGNNPGRMDLKVASGPVIEGFSDLILEENLCVINADEDYYYKKSLDVSSATIGIVIEPILEERVESFENSQWYYNTDGTENTLENFVFDGKVLLTLKNTQSYFGDGIDDTGSTGIVINTVMDESWFYDLDLEDTAPGTLSFAEVFTGITILVPAGEGWIVIDGETHDGYCIKMRSLFGDELEEVMYSENRERRAFYYNFDKPTFVGIYNGGQVANNARQRVIRPGKKGASNIKIFTVTVSPKTVKGSNPASAASEGEYNGSTPEVGQDEERPTEIISGIKDMEYKAKNADRWYNLNGQQIDMPQRKGLYIHAGKKVVFE